MERERERESIKMPNSCNPTRHACVTKRWFLGMKRQKRKKLKIKVEDTKETLLEEDRRKAILAKRCLFYSSFSFCYLP